MDAYAVSRSDDEVEFDTYENRFERAEKEANRVWPLLSIRATARSHRANLTTSAAIWSEGRIGPNLGSHGTLIA